MSEPTEPTPPPQTPVEPVEPEPDPLDRSRLPKISVGHDRFARYYAMFGKPAAAAVAAGYSKVSSKTQGHKLVNRPEVRMWIDYYIHRQMAEEADIRRELGRVYVLRKLKELVEDREVENSVKLGALKLLGTENGMFRERQEAQDREVPVKVFLGVDPARLGVAQSAGAVGGVIDVTNADRAIPDRQPRVVKVEVNDPKPAKEIQLPDYLPDGGD